MQKGFSSVIILIIILLSAGIVGAYYFGKLSNKSTQSPPSQTQTPQPTLIPQPTSTSDETTNWKTYTSNEYGYSFRYPNDWDAIVKGTSLIIAPQSIIADIKKIPGGFGGGKGLVSALYVNKERVPTKSDEFQQVSSTQITIDGKNATLHVVTVTQESPLGKPGDQVIQIEIPFDKGFIEYELVDTKYRSIYDQILSTFKFLDQNQTEDRAKCTKADDCTVERCSCEAINKAYEDNSKISCALACPVGEIKCINNRCTVIQ